MKKAISLTLALLLTLSLAACGTGGEAPASTGGTDGANEGAGNTQAPQSDGATGGEIVITYPTYRVGSHLSAGSEKAFIDGFNEQYAGQYRVEVEELPSDQAYVEKMKVLASSNALPDVVEGKDGVLELAIRNGQAIDLTDLINADAAYKAEIGEGAIAANTIDGKLYSIANGNQLIGYYYNKAHFEQAGITPADTWEEFMDNCEKLSAAGHIPISLMTGENCWTTNLLLASIIGTANAEGNAFMNTMYPDSYETPEMVAALEMVAELLANHTTLDALGGGYDVAANHFLQGNTSIICNGPWMTGDFSNPEKAVDGLNENVGVALYPNAGVFAQYEIGYMVCASEPEKQEAAFAFIQYKTNATAQKTMLEWEGTVPLTPDVELSDEYKAESPLVAEIIELSSDAKYQYRTLDAISYAGVIDEMSKTYPALSMGDVTAEEMSQALTAAAEKSK